jgi:pectate lyase
MKNFLAVAKLLLVTSCFILTTAATGQTVLINHNFQTTTLPAGVTSNGAISPTKAADGVCSQGMIQVNAGQFLQIDIASCSDLRLHMKSTSSTARLVTVKYQKDGDPSYTTVTTSLSVQTAAIFNLTTLYPALVSSVPISIRVEPAGNIQIHDLIAVSTGTQSSAAEITSFKLNGQIGNETINSGAGTIGINVPVGTPLASVVPQTVTISAQASINPLPTSAQNFTSPVIYTVTAQDGTTKNWTVTVTQVASAAKDITAFVLSASQMGAAVINATAGTVGVTMPIGTNLSNITPTTLTISANATISPTSSTPRDFSVPVAYTVTAQDGTTKNWTITVTTIDPAAVYTDYEAEEANYTGTVDNDHMGYTGTGFVNFLAGGENALIFTLCQTQAGNRNVKFRYALANDEDRKGKLFVNDVFIKVLTFPRTVLWTDWAEETAAITVQNGINNIKITWDSTDGPNIDKMLLTGQACNTYTLSTSATNGGSISVSPARFNNKYFDGETVTVLAQGTASVQFNNWSGDLTGNTNPTSFTINSNKTIVGNFSVVPTYVLNVSVNGIGQVDINPPGGVYAAGATVTLTPQSVLGSTFTGWSGDATGTGSPITVTMNAAKNITATFSSGYTINFNSVVGFAATPGDGFTGPTTGGQCAPDTVVISSPSAFNQLCESLYYRQQAYKNNVTTAGMKKAPLVILLKAGIYDGTQTLSTNGAKVFGNSMLDIPEQCDLSFVGESGVVFKIGINVKRAWNVLIRNISFYDYYDDGINIGYPQTHHIWIDHCTFGHPTTLPSNIDHPDGGCDVKDGASYITISWCLFRNSWKTSLIGHSDGNGATDIGRLKVTMVNNHFLNTNSRNPRVRFGEVHVLNNLSQNVMLYGIAAANSARVFAENNFYLNTDWPMYADRTTTDFKLVYGNNSDNTYTSKTGNYPAVGLKQAGNEYDDSGLPVITAQLNATMKNPGGRSVRFDELNPSSVFDPRSYYNYTPMTAQETKVIVPLFAGADKVNFNTSSCGSLPLNLLSFEAVLQNSPANRVALTWKTTAEVNTSHFEIQKSIENISYITLASVSALNLPGEHDYSAFDPNPNTGLSYYRLKQVDRDGRTTFSGIRTINNTSSQKLSVFPNPANNKIVIRHTAPGVSSMITIFSAEGRVVKKVPISGFATITDADISILPPGSYFVFYDDGKEKYTTRFMKL